MTLAIGIDVGGTKIAAGVVDTSTGALEARFERGTRPERGSDAVLADCVALAQRLAAGREDLPIGMGVCELIDLDGTRAIGADARVAARRPRGRVRGTRTRRGRERRARRRTGGGALRRRPRRGGVAVRDRRHGHLLLPRPRRASVLRCARGNAICFGAPPLEQAASGIALAAAGGRERAEEVIADASLDSVVEAAAAELGVGLAWLVNALDPGVVVIGGGLGLVDRYRELAVDGDAAARSSPTTRAACPSLLRSSARTPG